MHPGSSNTRPDPKAPIDRHSLTDGGLKGIYERYNGPAKDVGTDRAQTNFVDVPQQFSNQFKVKTPVGFTSDATNYSTDVLKLNTTKYAPSGRL